MIILYGYNNLASTIKKNCMDNTSLFNELCGTMPREYIEQTIIIIIYNHLSALENSLKRIFFMFNNISLLS